MPDDKKKKVTLVVFSGDMDKLFGAYSIAASAAAANMEVSMFFTFWGLRALKKRVKTGKSLLGRALGIIYGGDIARAAPSKMSFFGIGRWMFKKMMKAKNVPSLPELRQTALDLGVKMYGCQMSMEVMEIPEESMIDEVKGCVGAAFMVDLAQQSEFSLFI